MWERAGWRGTYVHACPPIARHGWGGSISRRLPKLADSRAAQESTAEPVACLPTPSLAGLLGTFPRARGKGWRLVRHRAKEVGQAVCPCHFMSPELVSLPQVEGVTIVVEGGPENSFQGPGLAAGGPEWDIKKSGQLRLSRFPPPTLPVHISNQMIFPQMSYRLRLLKLAWPPRPASHSFLTGSRACSVNSKTPAG